MIKPYQKLRFNRAIAWFRRKLPLPTERWDQIIDSAQSWAFTIAGIESANILQSVQDKLTQILSGQSETADTFGEFRQTFKKAIAAAGYTKQKPWRSTLVFRNNINSAYNAGRFQQILESPNEYVQYWHDHPITPRPSHLALHRMVFRKDDPVLRSLNPPNGHGCMCRLLSLSQEDIDAEGLEVSTLTEKVTLRDRLTGREYTVPAVRVDGELVPVVEPGFHHSPGLDDESRQGEILEGAIARLSPRLQSMVRGKINGANQN